jgi:DHA2 family methylenomycin A resistance protein-like MFS transporter
VASVGCALAPSLPALIAFRTQQALAGALALPNGIAIVRSAVPVERRGAAFGMIGLATGLAAALGPPFGGLLIHAAGWPAIFWANLPVVLTAGLLALVLLPDDGGAAGPRPGFDLTGSGLLALTLGGLVAVPTLVKAGHDLLIILAILGSVLSAVGFVAWERRRAWPVIDLRLFTSRAFAAACGSIALSNLVMYTTLLALPLYLERVQNESARATGGVLAALSLLAAIGGPVGGRIADRAGRRRPAVAGAVALTLGVATLAMRIGGTQAWVLVIALIVMGSGLGLQSAPVQTAAVERVPGDQTASAAGVYSTARYLGSIAGSTILALAFAHPGPDDAARFAALFMGLTAVAIVGLIVNRQLGP